MKKYLPFVFPAAALVIVALLAFRWYNMQTTTPGEVGPSSFAEGVQIEDLTDTERNQVMLGAGDFETTMLENSEQAPADTMGQVRYEIMDGKVRFSVMAGLPELTAGQYQVWLKDIESDAIRKAFALEFSKGGHLGSAAISEEVLPFELIVSEEMVDDDQPEKIIMRGQIGDVAAEDEATDQMEEAESAE